MFRRSSKSVVVSLAAVALLLAGLSAVPVVNTAHALFGNGAETEDAAETAAPSGGFFNQTRPVDMPPLLAPAEQDGRLRYYYFVKLSLQVRGGEVWRVRERVPFVQDAFVTSVYGRPLTIRSADGFEAGEVDAEALHALLLETARRELGEDIVVDVEIKSLVRGLP